MKKILFVCHGTTPISSEIPPKTTKKHDFFAFYYKFTTFSSSDMTKKIKSSPREASIPPLSELLFVCLLFFPKPVVPADEHF